MIDSGSLQLECNQRLTNLYNTRNGWLVNEAKKIQRIKKKQKTFVVNYLNICI